MSTRDHFVWRLTFVILWVLAGSLFFVQAQQGSTDITGQLRYRYIGPVGNRVTSVVGVPEQPNIYYAGAASVGVVMLGVSFLILLGLNALQHFASSRR